MTTKRVKRALTAAWFALLVGKIIFPFSYRSNSSTQFRRSMIGCLDSAAENKPSLIPYNQHCLQYYLLDGTSFSCDNVCLHSHCQNFVDAQQPAWTRRIPEPWKGRIEEKVTGKKMKWVKTIGKKNLTANRQKGLYFYPQQSKMQIASFKEFQSCLFGISADRHGLLAPEESSSKLENQFPCSQYYSF